MATSRLVESERPQTRAVVKYVGRSAYKVRQVCDLIRGKDAEEAQNILLLCNRGAAEEVGKLLNSAMANASHNQNIPGEELFVKEIFADEGPTMKRFKPRARGRASSIRKRMSHVTIVLERKDDDAIAEPQPNVLNLASVITLLPSTSICKRITSPHSGAPTKPVPTVLLSLFNVPTLRGLV